MAEALPVFVLINWAVQFALGGAVSTSCRVEALLRTRARKVDCRSAVVPAGTTLLRMSERTVLQTLVQLDWTKMAASGNPDVS